MLSVRAVAAVTLAVGGLAGCSVNSEEQKTAPRSSLPSVTAGSRSSGGPSTSANSQTPLESSGYAVSKPHINSAAQQALGGGAADGTATAVAFAERNFYDDRCFVTAPGTDVDSCARSIGDAMTIDGRADWLRSVNGFLRDAAADRYGKSQDSGNVLSLTFYGGLSDSQTLDDGRKLAATAAGPVFVDKKILDVMSMLDSDGRLQVDLRASAQARVLVNGESKLWPFTRQCTFYMKHTKGSWKIDGWHGSFHAGTFRPE